MRQPAAAASVEPAPAAATIYHRTVAVRHISIVSVFKVSFLIYTLLLAVVGCVVVVLPGLLGASLLGALTDDRYSVGMFSSGLAGTLVLYVVLVIGFALAQGLISAIAAVFYNLVAGWVGGVEVDLKE
jgi:hypothetical protein